MPHFTFGRSAPRLAAIALLGACTSGEPRPQFAIRETHGTSVIIQMSGLMMLVPAHQGDGSTHLLMPHMDDHLSWIGFRAEPSATCSAYDEGRGICYVDMNGWSLEPIGGEVRAAGRAPLPETALNLSHAAGGMKVNLPRARGRARTEMTLAAGEVTGSCSLARWTVDPAGAPPPSQRPLANVLEWQIPNLPADHVRLVRCRLRNPAERQEFATLVPDAEGRIELLVMHVPTGEMMDLLRPAARPASIRRSDLHASGDPSENRMAAKHMNAFYDLVEAPEAPRTSPQDPERHRETCPLTILGLDAPAPRQTAYTLASYSTSPADPGGLQPASHAIAGTKTPSCIMASAEEGP